MTLTEATQKIEKMAELHGGKLKAKTNFQFDTGIVHLDDTVSPTQVSNDTVEADCTIKINLDDFSKLISGDLNPMMAFMTGKMKVEGDKGIAMKMSGFF